MSTSLSTNAGNPSLGNPNHHPLAESHRAALLVRGQHRAADSALAREASQTGKPDPQQQAARKAPPAR